MEDNDYQCEIHTINRRHRLSVADAVKQCELKIISRRYSWSTGYTDNQLNLNFWHDWSLR